MVTKDDIGKRVKFEGQAEGTTATLVGMRREDGWAVIRECTPYDDGEVSGEIRRFDEIQACRVEVVE